jgi:hypothetical protein
VLDAKRIGKLSKLNDKNLMDVSDSILWGTSKSWRKRKISVLQQRLSERWSA